MWGIGLKQQGCKWAIDPPTLDRVPLSFLRPRPVYAGLVYLQKPVKKIITSLYPCPLDSYSI